MEALVIGADGAAELASMPHEVALRLAWVHAKVGGYVEAIVVRPRWRAYLDEGGKTKGREINILATEIAHVSGWHKSDVLVGPVVFCGLGYDGNDDADVPADMLDLAGTVGVGWMR